MSRWTEVRHADIEKHDDLAILAESDESGVCIAQDEARRRAFVFNHFEYDANTLKKEYFRDLEKDDGTRIPAHYFPQDDPAIEPRNDWRSHAQLLYGNWINQIYQTTNFDISKIGT